MKTKYFLRTVKNICNGKERTGILIVGEEQSPYQTFKNEMVIKIKEISKKEAKRLTGVECK